MAPKEKVSKFLSSEKKLLAILLLKKSGNGILKDDKKYPPLSLMN